MKNQNKKLYLTKTILFILVYLFFIIINIFKPDNFLKYLWSFYLWIPLTSYVIFWEGKNYFKIYKLIFKGVFNMNTLIGLSIHVLYLFSVLNAFFNFNKPFYSYEQMWGEIGILTFMMSLGHYIEHSIRKNTNVFYQKMNEYGTKKITIIKKNVETKKFVQKIQVNEVIQVKKGQMILLDGQLLEKGSFDYSNITGESKKVILAKNQNILSGAFNVGSPIKIKVKRNFEHSNINKIFDSIKKTIKSKPKMQKYADRILRFFVPSVIAFACLTFVFWIILGYAKVNLPWVNGDNIFFNALRGSVSVLAIACPCALGMATPLIYLVSSSHLIKSGIVVNEPQALEAILQGKYIAFDKTGTLTNEKMKVVEIMGDKSYLPIVKGLERNTLHPIGKALMKLKGQTTNIKNVFETENGIKGSWKNKDIEIKTENNINQPLTVVSFFIEGEKKITFKLESKLKTNALKVIERLKKNKLVPLLITGDNEKIANLIAKKLKIKNVFANASPQEKAKIIARFQKQNKVIFVGDGFNDAISMKKADISISFLSGNEITNYLSDFSIQNNNLTSVSKLFLISKMNRNKVLLSLFYAFVFNLLCIPLAFLLIIQPWLAALMMTLSNILVFLNALIYQRTGKKKLEKF